MKNKPQTEQPHRIGQNKKVMVYQFYFTTNTVEEKIQNLKAKTELAESVISTEQAVKTFNTGNNSGVTKLAKLEVSGPINQLLHYFKFEEELRLE
ncbi:MAG: hypothetical protein MZW92_37490 [Comamonadaceae bacterium]|nr:hypothetical protein [Comamonadaceae bacterium]